MPVKKVIETKKLSRVFKNGAIEVHALTDADILIEEGEFVAIMGASGWKIYPTAYLGLLG